VASTCVVGLQWGDEAKGKIVDLLCDRHDAVVRYQGGANAGHTVVADGVTYKPGGRLHVSDRAHVILPYHLAEERLTEESASAADHLGTTRRGIGPCYRDKVGRVHGVRVGDLYHPDRFRAHLERIVAFKNRLLTAMLPAFDPFDATAVADEYLGYAGRLRPFVRDTTLWLHAAIARGKRLMFEGAQGSLLDVDHGSYPYVTSSNSSAAGIAAGSGVPTRHIDRWIGIVKAYTTRVGGGPFPTELDNEIGERIRRIGREYGTVTGRPRRCGWFDAVAARYSARISGSTEIAVMLLDVLSGLKELKVAVGYEDEQGHAFAEMPGQLADLERCRPVYHTLPGWPDDLTKVRDWSHLPAAARQYVQFLAQQIGVPVSIVSVGPERNQTITNVV
jgi:adenylosuccinate synthase